MIAPHVSVVCSSESVNRWWRQFLSPMVQQDVYWPQGPDSIGEDDVINALAATVESSAAVFVLSEHRSLERDARLVDRLRSNGHVVVGTGSREAMFELDKTSAKSLLDGCGVASPVWSFDPLPDITSQLLKARRGTEAREVRWYREGDSRPAGDTCYFEQYVQGVEYSVMVLKSRACSTTLPAVWKGETNADLNPPYKRLRLCGPRVVEPALDARLRHAAVQAAEGLEGPCVLEVEFVVLAGSEILILEINPRIAGTTRMAAIAAKVFFLDLCLVERLDFEIHAVQHVAELPIESRGASSVLSEKVMATSRLALAGRSWAEVGELLDEVESAGWRVDPRAATHFRNIEAAASALEGAVVEQERMN